MSDRMIPPTWFRAVPHQTTMSIFHSDAQERTAPIRPGERKLGWFVLPAYQRPAVWTDAQKVRFIESCWLGLPIGVFVYNRTEDADTPHDNVLLDGQQRITAIYEYMDDAFPVFGHLYSELSKVDHRKWTMATLFTALETNLTDEAALREVYDRLAYGGTPHEPKDA